MRLICDVPSHLNFLLVTCYGHGNMMQIILSLVTHAAPCFVIHLVIAIVITVTVLNRKRSTNELEAALMRAPVKKQVIKTFSKNVEGCRDGSAKNHRN